MHTRVALRTGFVSLVIGLVLVGFGPRAARADDCTDAPPAGLGGTVNGASECEVSASVAVTGTFDLAHTLRVKSGVTIDATSGGITLNVCNPAAGCDVILESGATIEASDPAAPAATGASSITINVDRDLIMESGSALLAENLVGGGEGGVITIVAGRSVRLLNNAGSAPGATISTEKQGTGTSTGVNDIIIRAGPPPQAATGQVLISEFSLITTDSRGRAGDIAITAGNSITVHGTVTAEGTTGAGQGGTISLVTCTLLVGDSGVVSSRGQDPGADLVHLEGCKVTVNGLVESTGEAHATNIPNLCRSDPRGAAHVQTNRPGFTNWTACVEIWSGTTVLIDRTGSAKGEVNADTCTAAGGCGGGGGWIDIYARGSITIVNDTTTFAVHANQPGGPTNLHGGLVRVTSLQGSVVAGGPALQASARTNTSDGGEIVVEGFKDVILQAVVNLVLTGASIEARGDDVAAGGFGDGGRIAVQAFTGEVTWPLGTGDVRPTGADVAANDGVIALQGCTAVNLGASFPTNGAADPGFPAVVVACAPGGPVVPAYLTDGLEFDLPPADCLRRCGEGPGGGDGDCFKSSVQSVLDPQSGRFKNNQGPDYVVRVHAPFNELIQPVIDAATDQNGDGHVIILVVAKDQGALGGHTTQNVLIDRDYSPDTFGLIACSVTVHALDPLDPTGSIAATAGAAVPPAPATGNIFVMDLHAADSGVAGWLGVGDGRYLRNINTLGNANGIALFGGGNTVHNGTAEGNLGLGIAVFGDGNLVTDAKVLSSGSHGIAVLGAGNTVQKVDVGDRNKGNGGDGVHVEGTGNTVSEADAFANVGHGIFVRGDLNQLRKNNAGDRSKGNGLDGIHAGGNGNTLTENDAYANAGNGIAILGNGSSLKNNRAGDAGKGNAADGIRVEGSQNALDGNRASGNQGDGFDFARAAGTDNVLKANRSNDGGAGGQKENAGCEYRFAESTSVDAGGNREDSAVLPSVAGKFPAGCYE